MQAHRRLPLPRRPCGARFLWTLLSRPSTALGRQAHLTGQGAGRRSACCPRRTCWPAEGGGEKKQHPPRWDSRPPKWGSPVPILRAPKRTPAQSPGSLGPRPYVWPHSGASTGFAASGTELVGAGEGKGVGRACSLRSELDIVTEAEFPFKVSVALYSERRPLSNSSRCT